MAIRTTYKYKCDLDKGTLETSLRNSLMQADALADAFAVTVQRNGEDVNISGMTVYGYLYASATKTTVPLKGTVSGSTATVILSEDCYAVPGYASLMIQLHDGDVRHTVLKVDFVVTRTGGTLVLDGDNILPTLAELLGQIAAMEQATAEAREAAAAADAAREGIQGDLAALAEEIEDIAVKKSAIPFLNLRKYVTPSEFGSESQVNIFTDGNSYFTDYKAENFMNLGGNTYYVSNKNAFFADGLTRETATTFTNAYNLTNDGDTIVFLEGLYDRSCLTWQTEIEKSLNIIGEGNVLILDGEKPTFVKTSEKNNVYEANRSQAWRVLDFAFGYDKIIAYSRKTSIDEVDSEKGTYFISGNKVYVNPQNSIGDVFVCVDYEKEFDINNAKQSVRVYVSNFTLVGKKTGIKIIKDTEANDIDVCFDNVSTIYCGDESKDSFLVYGANCVFHKCKALNSAKDGFNYSGVLRDASVRTNHVVTEIDCIGAGCGHGTPYNNMNGSTAHNGSKVVRVNGKYYDTQGPPIADVGDGTRSINLGCNVWNPKKLVDGEEEWTLGVAVQQSGAVMWCENCLAVGATGGDFYAYADATLHLRKCGYGNKAGNGTIEEVETRNIVSVLLANQNFLNWN